MVLDGPLTLFGPREISWTPKKSGAQMRSGAKEKYIVKEQHLPIHYCFPSM